MATQVNNLHDLVQNMKNSMTRTPISYAEIVSDKCNGKTSEGTNKPVTPPTFQSSTNHLRISNKDDIEIVMCFDSNRKFIDFKKLWTLMGSLRKNCSRIRDVVHLVENVEKDTDIKRILISTGVNDLDYSLPEEVAAEFGNVINVLREKFPQIIIILSELTPRKDELDNAVIPCNELLKQLVGRYEHIFFINHSNMRDSSYSLFYDEKHIHKRAIPKFAANIKRVLRCIRY